MVSEQVYQSEHMIKKLQPEEIIEHVQNRLGNYRYIMETDYSKYDAS